MAVNVSNVGGAAYGYVISDTSRSANITVSANTDRILIVLFMGYYGTNPPAAPTFNGSSFTLAVSSGHSATLDFVQIWYLVNPSVGTFALQHTQPADSIYIFGYINAYGANQTSPIFDSDSAVGSGIAASLTLSSLTNQLVVGGIARPSDTAPTIPGGSGQTNIYNFGTGGESGRASYESGASSVVHSYNLDATDDYAIAAIAIAEAGSSAQNVTLPTIAAGGVVYSPTVTQNIGIAHISSIGQVHSPSIVYNISLPTITDTSTLYDLSLLPEISAPFINTEVNIYAPTLAQNINIPIIESVLGLFTPTITSDLDTLYLPYIENISELYNPGTIYTEEDLLFPPSISQPSIQDIVLPNIDSVSSLYAQSLSYSIVLPTIVGAAQTFNPALRQRIALPHIAKTNTLYAVSISQNIALPLMVESNELYAPLIGAGSSNLFLPFIDTAAMVYEPNIFIFGTIVLPLINSAVVLNVPAFSYNISIPAINSSSTIYTLSMSIRKTKLRVLSERSKSRVLTGKRIRIVERTRELNV